MSEIEPAGNKMRWIIGGLVLLTLGSVAFLIKPQTNTPTATQPVAASSDTATPSIDVQTETAGLDTGSTGTAVLRTESEPESETATDIPTDTGTEAAPDSVAETVETPQPIPTEQAETTEIATEATTPEIIETEATEPEVIVTEAAPQLDESEPQVTNTLETAALAPQASTTTPLAVTPSQDSEVSVGNGQSDATVPVLSTPQVSTTDLPSFDLVRVDATGSGLVAGRAKPGSKVTIKSGETEIAVVEASSKGEFVAFISAPSSSEGQNLFLLAEDQSGKILRSGDEVFILPVSTTDEVAAAPAIVQASTDTVRVLQPGGLADVVGVTLDSISYNDVGAVVLAGRAPSNAPLRVYADGRAQADVTTGGSGSWQTTLSGIAEGVYTLRVDELGSDGSVKSRVESPFQRVFPNLAERGASSITVQPGNTLWVMARERYGSGILYTQIYAANQTLIRDPDLIYPGQIFDLPADRDVKSQ